MINKLGLSWVIAMLIVISALCYVFFNLGQSEASKVKKKAIHDTVTVIQWEGHIDTVLKADRRLWWMYVANKYKDLSPEGEHVEGVLDEAMLTDSSGILWGMEQRLRQRYVNYALCVGTLETGKGNAGIGEPPKNNHVGLKYSPNYFNWSIKKGSSNDAMFEWWGFSYYNLIERRIEGFPEWTNCWGQAGRELF